ncbi:hypothetical protein AMK59_6305 [Oryctes borbonicus]|uniref:BRCT domain-containing protein n=1 Tax=Oryctes borbonicus TaxID=1629725 RepID=A0A0T6B0I2_9SCAR|nr:hypothetical protein AMK59_6305 [Oryctes borbonicus]
MPKIKIEKVVSFSSEDPVHLANNILSNDPSKKWKCQTAGAKAANLVLQLEEAAIISSIDIGNEHSAYVEVLVSRSCSNEGFKVLLVMSSFMSPLESRQSTNINKVRMFSYDQLSAPERDEKWDRIKIVCTQPFNRHVQYGLSFITFHTSIKDEEKGQVHHVGKFALRPESPNNIIIGSLFARKKELQENKPVTAAAAIRNASLSPHQTTTPKKVKIPQNAASASQDIDIPSASRARDEIFYKKDEEGPNDKIDAIMEQKKVEREKLETQKVATPAKAAKPVVEKPVKDKENGKKKKNADILQASTSKAKGESSKRKLTKVENTPNKKMKQQTRRPFHQLLSDVGIVISGIQNPDRANIRGMALAMGAKYKANWDPTCTHLVCAFTNTPKFNQVKGKGKIVSKSWVTDCHSKRRKLPWRRYALDNKDKNKAESEEEILEEVVNQVSSTPVEVNSDDDDNRDNRSGSDTEDEIERINTLQNLKDKSESSPDQTEIDTKDSAPGTATIFDDDTDIDEPLQPGCNGENGLPSLPNFFEGEVFYIGDSLSADEKKTLTKYITACNGTIKNSLGDDVKYLIATKEDNLDTNNLGSGILIVHPNFVYECFNSKMLVPVENFVL